MVWFGLWLNRCLLGGWRWLGVLCRSCDRLGDLRLQVLVGLGSPGRSLTGVQGDFLPQLADAAIHHLRGVIAMFLDHEQEAFQLADLCHQS